MTDAFAQALGNGIVEQAATKPDLGSGLKLSQEQSDSLGKKYDFEQTRYVRPNYAPIDDGQSVKLSAQNVKSDLEKLTELFYPKDGVRAGFSEAPPLLLAQSSKVMSDAPSSVIPETFSQGYAAGRLREAPSVTRPTTAASFVGRVLGGSLTSTGDMFDALTGRASAEAAYRSFANGDVVNGSLLGLKSLGEAALTVFSGGSGSVMLQGARTMTAVESAALRNGYASEAMLGAISGGVEFGLDAARSGGPLRELSNANIKITSRGVDVVEKHIARFGDDPANNLMVERLRGVAAGGVNPTVADYNFYSHELREFTRVRRMGFGDGALPGDVYYNAHSATLREYGIRPQNYDQSLRALYHPDAIKLMGGR